MRRWLSSLILSVFAVVFAVPVAAGYVTFGNGFSEKWDDPVHGTAATITWGFMLQATTVDASVPVASEVVGGSDITAMRSDYDSQFGAGAFDAAIQRAFDTWEAAAGVTFVGPVADSGAASGSPGATSPDIRIGAFIPVPLSPFSGLGAVGYGPPFDDVGFPDAQAGDIFFNLGSLFIEPVGLEGDLIVAPGNDLENLTLHELGHAAMGLGHPASGPGDVLFVGAGCCDFINRELSPDDAEGARTVYGPVCNDGLDNDGDGFIDLADAGCDDANDTSEQSPSLPCDDGIDNDGDGGVDALGDVGCASPSSLREDPQCQDGVDNDGQLGTDFDGGESVLGVGNGDPNGADPQCNTPFRNKEAANTSGGCGLGPELALLLPLLGGLARGRRRKARR